MNFWPRYPGDIQRKTGHLSCAEMGAYDRLLDHIYGTEQWLPADVAACCRIARAMDESERAAVASVLQQFFVLRDGKYINLRAEEEMRKARPKIEAARANGRKGGRPSDPARETQRVPAGLPMGTHDEPSPKAPQNQNQNQNQNIEALMHAQSARACVEGFAPTEAGTVCRVMKAAGVIDVNPGHPDLIALVDAGATAEEFRGAAEAAARKRKGFAYALATLIGQRKEAAQRASEIGQATIQSAEAWFETAGGIKAKGAELGIPYTREDECHPFPSYRARVFEKAGHAPRRE